VRYETNKIIFIDLRDGLLLHANGISVAVQLQRSADNRRGIEAGYRSV